MAREARGVADEEAYQYSERKYIGHKSSHNSDNLVMNVCTERTI